MAMTNHLLCYLVHVKVLLLARCVVSVPSCQNNLLNRLGTVVLFYFFRTHLSNLTQVQCIDADIPAQLINFYGFRPQLNGRVLLKQQF